MADDTTTQEQEALEPIPGWFAPIRSNVIAQNANTFLITGNVRDFPPGSKFTTLYDTIVHHMQRIAIQMSSKEAPLRTIPIRITQTAGMEFQRSTDIAKANAALLDLYRQDMLQAGVKDPDTKRAFQITNPANMSFSSCLSTLTALLRSDLIGIVAVLDYIQYGTPKASSGFQANASAVETIREWSSSLAFTTRMVPVETNGEVNLHRRYRPSWVFLLADNAADVHPELTTCPTVVPLQIPLPNRAQREERINTLAEYGTKYIPVTEDTGKLARSSAGLTSRDLVSIFWEATVNEQPLSLDVLTEAKRKRIEDRFSSVLSPVEPRIDFSHIGGHEHVKHYFDQIQSLLTAKADDLLPSGFILVGPPGTAKSILVEAASKELGVQMVRMDPDKTYNSLLGETEKNVRRAFDCVIEMAPCFVFIDELDQAFQRGASGDSGVSQRIFKMFLEFLADPDNARRGIIFAAASNQPSAIDAALMRPGRFGDVIPVLPPRSAEGRWEIAKAIASQGHLTLDMDDATGIAICSKDIDKVLTGAEIREVLYQPLRDLAMQIGKRPDTITAELLTEGFDYVKPTTREVGAWTEEAISFASKEIFIPREYRGIELKEKSAAVEFGGDIQRDLL